MFGREFESLRVHLMIKSRQQPERNKKASPKGLLFLCSEGCLSVAKLLFDPLYGLGDDQRS